ncbi:MAG: NAD(P)-binding protein [Rhodospirillales bacterium]
MNEIALTYRRYQDGDDKHLPWSEHQVSSGESYRCPTYVHSTPPCQDSCPSGHDVRGWLNIVRGIEKPPADMSWREYAFRRMTQSNPFPAIMGRVCPAPCQDGCNRNNVEDFVGINSIEHFIGNWAIDNSMSFAKPNRETGKKVAIVGGGPAGLSAAYQLRRMGHACTIFEARRKLGGMMQYGLSNHRCPRHVVDAEVKRIIDLGVEVRNNTKIGVDISIDRLDKDFDAVFWGIGAQIGKPMRYPGADAPNCTDGLSFLNAANEGRLKYLTGRVLVIGGGDTAMDCAAVARRLGSVGEVADEDLPENVLEGGTVHQEPASKGPAEVVIVYRRPISMAPATKSEIEAVLEEGVVIREALAPVEVIKGQDGRATALRVIKADWSTGEMVTEEGSETDIECSLIIAATGQKSDFEGIEDINCGEGWVDADKLFRVKGQKGHFTGGDAVDPKLLTTAIGQGWKAAVSIDDYVNGVDNEKRPKVQVHYFDLLAKLKEAGLEPQEYTQGQTWGTAESGFAVHNYEDRSSNDVVKVEGMFTGHFTHTPRLLREVLEIGPGEVVGDARERLGQLSEEDAVKEADRCMSCGLCFECDNCVIFCPMDAVHRVKKDKKTMGRYVDTDYSKCIGCEICMDVCPTGYIHMGLE